jgi:predicted enzyme related to lactoylglutathione lyase
VNIIDKITMFHLAVTDMARAKDFYGRLGFSVIQDYGQGDRHWVSMAAPGGGPAVNLTTAHENMKAGTMKLYLSTPDIGAAYEELKKRGISPTSPIADDSWGRWFGLSDPDGNRLLVVQS